MAMTNKFVNALVNIAKINTSVPYYYQLGLLSDDMFRDNQVVNEALRRLPRELREARDFRVTIAGQLSMTKEILPENKWTRAEEDVAYLVPYIKMIEKEMQLKKAWDDM